MMIRNHLLLVMISSMLVCSSASPAQEHRPEHTWSYSGGQGPNHWGDLKPEFAACKTGHRQSPIDIRNTRKADLPHIQFDYKSSPLHIIDDGHTIMINYGSGSYISVGGKTYELKQFHFHRPSEEKIRGEGYDMEAHLVHADQEGNLAVVAILLQNGVQNPLIHKLWDHLPKEKGKEEVLDSVEIDVAGLLPEDRSYYTFPGSLTTPPCSENVAWFVLKHPVAASAAEIEQFRRLYPNNVRPTQAQYDRVVLESK
jgi:carbonic anhydrase